MRVYVAGPMTGIPQFNYPAFIELQSKLEADGYDIVSPAELDDPADRAAALSSPDGARALPTHARRWSRRPPRWPRFLTSGSSCSRLG